jgi:hypothetical protein
VKQIHPEQDGLQKTTSASFIQTIGLMLMIIQERLLVEMLYHVGGPSWKEFTLPAGRTKKACSHVFSAVKVKYSITKLTTTAAAATPAADPVAAASGITETATHKRKADKMSK